MAKHRSPTAASLHDAPIAQLVEQLICNQWVGSSSLSGGTINFKGLAEMRWAFCFFKPDIEPDKSTRKSVMLRYCLLVHVANTCHAGAHARVVAPVREITVNSKIS